MVLANPNYLRCTTGVEACADNEARFHTGWSLLKGKIQHQGCPEPYIYIYTVFSTGKSPNIWLHVWDIYIHIQFWPTLRNKVQEVLALKITHRHRQRSKKTNRAYL